MKRMELLRFCMNRKIYRVNILLTKYRSCSSDGSKSLSKSYEYILRDKMKQFYSLIALEGIEKQEAKYIPVNKQKTRGESITVHHFVDSKRVFVKAGNGGDGGIHFLHLCFNEFAGMSGGDGGKGGHVLFKASYNKSSLSSVKTNIRSLAGIDGNVKNKSGANAPNIVIEVPVGTKFSRDGKEICQLHNNEDIFIAARGGAGGKGNNFYTTDVLQRIHYAQMGGVGEEFIYHLQMQIIANVGLIGCPNAGKSTLLRALSRARPEVASYAFTTLHPHIGVIDYEDFEKLRVADIPGLIDGSHRDEGLGIGFLCHVQRCRCLLYVIDMSQPDPIEQFNMLTNELDHFFNGLSKTPHCLVANKMDCVQAEENLKKFKDHFTDMAIIPISAKYGKNLRALASIMRYISEFELEEDGKQFMEGY